MSGRKRATTDRHYSAEDQALDQISKEAEERIQARRQARAEAREIRMREIERQQKEEEEKQKAQEQGSISAKSVSSYSSSRRGSNDSTESDASRDSGEPKDQIRKYKNQVREMEEKYKAAMVTNAQLDNVKTSNVFQLELLKEQLEEQEEAMLEIQREYKDKCRDYDFLKRDFEAMKLENDAIKQQMDIKDRLIKESGLVIVSTEEGEFSLSKCSDLSEVPIPSMASSIISEEAANLLKRAGEGTLGKQTVVETVSASVNAAAPAAAAANDGVKVDDVNAVVDVVAPMNADVVVNVPPGNDNVNATPNVDTNVDVVTHASNSSSVDSNKINDGNSFAIVKGTDENDGKAVEYTDNNEKEAIEDNGTKGNSTGQIEGDEIKDKADSINLENKDDIKMVEVIDDVKAESESEVNVKNASENAGKETDLSSKDSEVKEGDSESDGEIFHETVEEIDGNNTTIIQTEEDAASGSGKSDYNTEKDKDGQESELGIVVDGGVDSTAVQISITEHTEPSVRSDDQTSDNVELVEGDCMSLGSDLRGTRGRINTYGSCISMESDVTYHSESEECGFDLQSDLAAADENVNLDRDEKEAKEDMDETGGKDVDNEQTKDAELDTSCLLEYLDEDVKRKFEEQQAEKLKNVSSGEQQSLKDSREDYVEGPEKGQKKLSKQYQVEDDVFMSLPDRSMVDLGLSENRFGVGQDESLKMFACNYVKDVVLAAVSQYNEELQNEKVTLRRRSMNSDNIINISCPRKHYSEDLMDKVAPFFTRSLSAGTVEVMKTGKICSKSSETQMDFLTFQVDTDADVVLASIEEEKNTVGTRLREEVMPPVTGYGVYYTSTGNHSALNSDESDQETDPDVLADLVQQHEARALVQGDSLDIGDSLVPEFTAMPVKTENMTNNSKDKEPDINTNATGLSTESKDHMEPKEADHTSKNIDENREDTDSKDQSVKKTEDQSFDTENVEQVESEDGKCIEIQTTGEMTTDLDEITTDLDEVTTDLDEVKSDITLTVAENVIDVENSDIPVDKTEKVETYQNNLDISDSNKTGENEETEGKDDTTEDASAAKAKEIEGDGKEELAKASENSSEESVGKGGELEQIKAEMTKESGDVERREKGEKKESADLGESGVLGAEGGRESVRISSELPSSEGSELGAGSESGHGSESGKGSSGITDSAGGGDKRKSKRKGTKKEKGEKEREKGGKEKEKGGKDKGKEECVLS